MLLSWFGWWYVGGTNSPKTASFWLLGLVSPKVSHIVAGSLMAASLNVAFGLGFVVAGAFIAPRHQFRVAQGLSGVLLLYLVYAVVVIVVTGAPDHAWLEPAKGAGMALAAVYGPRVYQGATRSARETGEADAADPLCEVCGKTLEDVDDIIAGVCSGCQPRG